MTADAAFLGLPGTVPGSVVTVGTFDGVHRGHRRVLERLVERAKSRSLASVLVTFEPHPLEVVNPAAAPLLLSVGDEKLDALVDFGLDYAVVLRFTPALAAYSPEAFVKDLLLRRFSMREFVVGHDHGLGRGRTGNLDHLRSLGQRMGFPVHVVDPVIGADGLPISSTGARRAVAYGDLSAASDTLGSAYWFRGRVVRGEGRGRELGFPTLNLRLPTARKLLPPEGVYAVSTATPRGRFGGMMNLGPRPTFGDHSLSLEVHLFGAVGDWYGTDVRVEFVEKLRSTQRFAGVQELTAQLARDADAARRALTEVQTLPNLIGSAERPSSSP